MARKKKVKFLPYEELKKTYKKTDLTDNVKFNVFLSPLYLLLMFLFLHKIMNIPLFGHNGWWTGSLFLSAMSTGFYIFASNYFQPDLDQRNLPGMSHFPIGKKIKKFKFGRFLTWAVYPLNRFWFHLWQPFAKAFTHRGVVHWPIIGVWFRVLYLLCLVWIFQYVLSFFGLHTQILDFFEVWLKNFFPWTDNFGKISFLLLNFPIYLSDTVHIAVDFYDSFKKNQSFCPPRIPRGLIIKFINTIKGEGR